MGQTTVEIADITDIAATVYLPDSIGCTVPSGAAGTFPITVTTPFG
jgi:hypothetical protein